MANVHAPAGAYPMTQAQRDLIRILRKQENISPEVLDQLCQRHWECDFASLSIRQASSLISSLKNEKAEIHREIQILAGQQSLFGEVAS